MKIALIHMRHADSGGTERFLNHLACYLAERGEEVTIICRTHVAPPHPAVRFVVLRPFSLGKPHRIWQFARAVEKHVRSASYDVVYGLGKTWTHDLLRIGGGTTRGYLDSMQRRRPRLKDRVAARIEQKAMAPGAFRHIVANSHQSAAEIRRDYSVPNERLSVIHNFVDTTHFDRQRVAGERAQLKNALALPEDRSVLLFLGTGYDRKGLAPTLEAFARLDTPATLVVAGRDSQQSAFEAQAERLGIATHCRFLGECREPARLFSLADCYVLPARYEPFGFTVLEALSCGTPVIVSQNCGAREVVDDSVASIIGAELDIDELAAAMRRWLTTRGDVEVQKKCRQQALSFDLNAVMARHHALIERCAERTG